MEELAKKIQQRYVDEITSKYPIHRFFCLYLYLLAFYIFYIKNDPRLISSIREIKINYLFDFSGGLLAEVSLFQLMIAIMMTFITARLSYIIKGRSFKVLSSIQNFDNYLVTLKKTISATKPDNDAVVYTLTSDVSKQLDIKRVRLRSKQNVSEVTLTLVICMLIGVKEMIYVDWVLVMAGLTVIILAQWEAFKVYISEFLPYFVAEQILLGKDVGFSKNDGVPYA